MQINLHSVPALVSVVLMATLALMGWLGRRERLNTALAMFTSLLTLVSLFGFLGLVLDSPSNGRIWFRLMILTLTPTYWAGFYYVLVLTGFIDRMDERVLGLRMRHLAVLAVVLTASLQAVAQASSVLIHFDAETLEGMVSVRAPWLPLVIAPVAIYLLASFLVILGRAWRESEPGTPERRFLLLNIIGVVSIYFAGAGVAKIMAFSGLDGRPFVFLSYTLASVIFYLAKVRYQSARIRRQLDEINALNRSLEQKVEQRTRHLREAQARLVQAEKMASLGRLAAGVAHEVNNPLGALVSSNQTAARWRQRLADAVDSLPDDGEPRARKTIARALSQLEQGEAVIEQGAARVAETVERLRSFARLDQADLQVIDVHECIEDTLAMEPALAEDGLAVHRDFAPDLPRITCYPAQVNQVLVNLVANAADAMGTRGELWVSTARRDGQVEIAVRDSGCGIPEAQLEQVFDPGFTTKSRGVGTGLGLSICYQLVRDHGGDISIVSHLGQGTTVTVSLPLQAPEPGEPVS